MRGNRRGRLIIEGFQYRLLVFNLLYVFIVLLVFAGTLFFPLILALQDSTASLAEKDVVASRFLTLHAWFWPAVLVTFALLAFHSVLVSNRVAGALYRFRRVFEAVSGGDLTVRANIRKNDYLQKEADAINEMIAAVHARIKEMKDQQGMAHAKLEALKKAVEGGPPDEVSRAIKGLEVQAERFRVKMDEFRISAGGTSEKTYS